jgi:hypothetical protein
MDSTIILIFVISLVVCINCISGSILLNKINNPEKKLPGSNKPETAYSQYQSIPYTPTYP